jgi:hypothetical protein
MSDLRALLLTDVVDSTKLSLRIGDEETAWLWAKHDRAARDLLPAWHGREIDKTDGMLLLFEAASDAGRLCLGIPAGAQHARSAPEGARRSARGAGLAAREQFIGRRAGRQAAGSRGHCQVDRCARDGGRGGRPDPAVGARARESLDHGSLRIQSHGHWHLKGVDEPVELFEVADAAASFIPPPDADKAYRVVRQGDLWVPAREIWHSLLAERDSFVGRQDALRVLAKKLEGTARLVSILGMGGTGKTRLATHFAWTWLGDYPGGVWFCDLAQARSLDGILFAVAQGLKNRAPVVLIWPAAREPDFRTAVPARLSAGSVLPQVDRKTHKSGNDD